MLAVFWGELIEAKCTKVEAGSVPKKKRKGRCLSKKNQTYPIKKIIHKVQQTAGRGVDKKHIG